MRLTKKLDHYSNEQSEGYSFYCPACQHAHTFQVRGSGPTWKFDGNIDKPTFSPSLLMYERVGEWTDVNPATGFREFKETGPHKTICHLHVTAGELRYCGDNPHSYNGKIVPMVDIPEDYGV